MDSVQGFMVNSFSEKHWLTSEAEVTCSLKVFHVFLEHWSIQGQFLMCHHGFLAGCCGHKLLGEALISLWGWGHNRTRSFCSWLPYFHGRILWLLFFAWLQNICFWGQKHLHWSVQGRFLMCRYGILSGLKVHWPLAFLPPGLMSQSDKTVNPLRYVYGLNVTPTHLSCIEQRLLWPWSFCGLCYDSLHDCRIICFQRRKH